MAQHDIHTYTHTYLTYSVFYFLFFCIHYFTYQIKIRCNQSKSIKTDMTQRITIYVAYHTFWRALSQRENRVHVVDHVDVLANSVFSFLNTERKPERIEKVRLTRSAVGNTISYRYARHFFSRFLHGKQTNECFPGRFSETFWFFLSLLRSRTDTVGTPPSL